MLESIKLNHEFSEYLPQKLKRQLYDTNVIYFKCSKCDMIVAFINESYYIMGSEIIETFKDFKLFETANYINNKNIDCNNYIIKQIIQ